MICDSCVEVNTHIVHIIEIHWSVITIIFTYNYDYSVTVDPNYWWKSLNTEGFYNQSL